MFIPTEVLQVFLESSEHLFEHNRNKEQEGIVEMLVTMIMTLFS